MKRSTNAVAVLPLLGTALLAACGSDGTGPIRPLEALPRPLTVAEREVISGSNDFAFDLMRAVNRAEGGENVFISPLSVSMALGMTMNGAANTTYDEMRDALGFAGLDEAEIDESYRDLIDLLLGLDPTVELGIANSVWYRRDFPIAPSFTRTASDFFGAHVGALDFDDPSAPDRINDWVRRATRGRIDGIVDEISPDHVMYLVNAVHFRGGWATRFDADRTRTDTFAGSDGEPIPVRMMSGRVAARYQRAPGYTGVELPYGNGAFAMTIVLPPEDDDIDDFLATLDRDRWDAIVGSLREGRVDLQLPRFALEYERGLIDPLRALGIESAFSELAADFSRMRTGAGPRLVVNEVRHRTFVEVVERGTEAAAATSVGIVDVSAPPEPPTIRVDRPFVFAIRERFSGTILFIGKIVAPADV